VLPGEIKMIRDAFKMKLKPGCVAEYKKRHDEIWPELATAHTDAGIFDYSIYFDEETLSLFAFRKLTKSNAAADMKDLEIVKKWWDYMADLMEVHPDNRPVFTVLTEVFHME
jgi:L-rhamnose mutarotase